MDFVTFLRAMFALAIVIGLILGLAVVARRYAPQFLARLQAQRGARRLQVLETLVLDPARRLILVRVDDEERLLLLGDGREMIEPRPLKKPKPTEAPAPDSADKPASRFGGQRLG